jgi:hypothetical protein
MVRVKSLYNYSRKGRKYKYILWGNAQKGRDMGFSGKTAKISSIVAVLCILTYIAAIAVGIVRIVTNMGERRNLAETEFNDLADRATSSSVFLGFMSEAYQQTIRDYLNVSETLSGVIITGTYGEYAFERQSGETITWINGSPRFKTGLVFSGGPLYLPLRIDGQRNVTIQAVYNYLNYAIFQRTLRDVLFVVLGALIIALLTLLLEIFLKNKTGQPMVSGAPGSETANSSTTNQIYDEPAWDETDLGNASDEPRGTYSPRGNISRESFTADRLASELHRCASSQSDLVFIAMEWRDIKISDGKYSRFANEAVIFFKMRDLVFDKGENGISVIIPNSDIEQGISQAEEFYRHINTKMPEIFMGGSELCIGLSSRSGRLIDADRLMLESFSALQKALADPSSCVIAFKSDPEKYREFMSKGIRE